MPRSLLPEQELKLRRQYDDCLAQILHWGEKSGPWEGFLDHCLALIGDTTGVSRAYVFRFDPQARLMINTHEWTSPGMAPMLGVEVGFDEFPYWTGQLLANQAIVGSDLRRDLPPEVHEILTLQDILSTLVAPLTIAGQVWGCLGLDDCRRRREWSPLEVSGFRSACRGVAAWVGQRQAAAAGSGVSTGCHIPAS